MTLFKLVTETEIHVFDAAGRAQVHTAAKKALSQGQWVKWEDGTTVDFTPRSGNRVRHTITRVRSKNGQRTETFLKHVWRAP